MPVPAPIHVVLLGGSTGPLALARELSASGVCVHLSLQRSRPENRTRFADSIHPYESRADAPRVWEDLLLGSKRPFLGAAVFPCDDDAVEFLAERHGEVAALYALDHVQPIHLDAFLSKSKTAAISENTGVRLPLTWPIDGASTAERAFASGAAAVLLKPVHSHRFQVAFGGGGRKHFLAHNVEEFREMAERLAKEGIDAIATELIPGPDSASVTYYTHRAADGTVHFEFTKQVLRRFPRNEGPGSLHVVRWDEEIAIEARKLLDATGFTGYANIEFKRDERGGLPVMIELNPRFTASQELLVQCGIPAGRIVLDSALGRRVEPLGSHVQGIKLWDPARDLRAFGELRRLEGLGFMSWLRSIRGPKAFLLFRWSDPRPTLSRLASIGRKVIARPFQRGT